MRINFNILKDDISWESSIHQLNSDVLLRHIRMNSNVDDFNIDFSYCETKCEGNILSSTNQLIGTFFIS